MTHTTTDTAEARAETGIERVRRRRAERDASGVLYVDSSIYEGMEACLVRNGRTVAHVHRYADAVEIAAGLATAEAANGAGERERKALREALTAEDEYWQASRDLATAFARIRPEKQAVFDAAATRREKARAALADAPT